MVKFKSRKKKRVFCNKECQVEYYKILHKDLTLKQRNAISSRKYYASHKEQHNQTMANWRKRNPEKAREIVRRAVKKYYLKKKNAKYARERSSVAPN